MKKRLLTIAVVFLLAVAASAAPLCTAGATLASYHQQVCEVSGVLFDFTAANYYLATAGGLQSSVLSAQQITVTPTVDLTAHTVSLTFKNATLANPFEAGGAAQGSYSANYLFNYALTSGFAFFNQTGTLGNANRSQPFGTVALWSLSQGVNGNSLGITAPDTSAGPSGVPLATTANVSQSLFLYATSTATQQGRARIGNLLQRGNITISLSTAPEPGTIGLLASGLLGLALIARRRRS